MACYHPSDVPVSRKLRPDPTKPIHRVSDTVTVPCGHCLGCRADQARSWAVRIMHEAQVRENAWFLSLTYDDDHLPENGSLSPDHLRAFHRSLRKIYPARSLSYYSCGEYGDEKGRAHYHAVLCGPSFSDRDYLVHRNGAPCYTSETIANAWPHGLHELTALTYGGARYVAGYVRKKVRGTPPPVNPLTGELLEPEFARMSLRPAIGRLWIERWWQDVYPRDFVVMEGQPLKPPRYYDKWLDDNHPELMMRVREQRYRDAIEIGDDKLIMMEKVHRARLNLFSSRNQL